MNIHLITPVNPEPIHQPIHRPLYVLFLLVNTSEYLHGPEGIHLGNEQLDIHFLLLLYKQYDWVLLIDRYRYILLIPVCYTGIIT